MKSNAVLQSSKTDLLDGNDEHMSTKYSHIRIQLPKLDTIDTRGLTSRTNKHELHSNGFLSDSEVGGKRKRKNKAKIILFGFYVLESVVYSDYLTGKTMADFIGVSGLEKNIIEAIMNFSYYLTLGDLDAAFKAIKTVKKYFSFVSS